MGGEVLTGEATLKKDTKDTRAQHRRRPRRKRGDQLGGRRLAGGHQPGQHDLQTEDLGLVAVASPPPPRVDEQRVSWRRSITR